MSKWQITRVDQRWAMSRVETGGIASRPLNIFEKFRYYFRMRRHDRLYPNWKQSTPYKQEPMYKLIAEENERTKI